MCMGTWTWVAPNRSLFSWNIKYPELRAPNRSRLSRKQQQMLSEPATPEYLWIRLCLGCAKKTSISYYKIIHLRSFFWAPILGMWYQIMRKGNRWMTGENQYHIFVPPSTGLFISCVYDSYINMLESNKNIGQRLCLQSLGLAFLLPMSLKTSALDHFFRYAGWHEVHMCWGLNARCFHIKGDGHQPNSMGYIVPICTHYRDSLLKAWWPFRPFPI